MLQRLTKRPWLWPALLQKLSATLGSNGKQHLSVGGGDGAASRPLLDSACTRYPLQGLGVLATC